ncbi:hypothetical protein DdX_17887 [Ditylenchus destructor]|uniref:Uncharacterized protein n=1 Tax=Ditylenchus destructor TaxID=166010 RepID=A0AAD4QT54_9BILA|nr:hypothetical protein DdX_17887 [Ditylenchus destructor]
MPTDISTPTAESTVVLYVVEYTVRALRRRVLQRLAMCPTEDVTALYQTALLLCDEELERKRIAGILQVAEKSKSSKTAEELSESIAIFALLC